MRSVFDDVHFLIIIELCRNDVPGGIVDEHRQIYLFRLSVFSYWKIGAIFNVSLIEVTPVLFLKPACCRPLFCIQLDLLCSIALGPAYDAGE